MPIQSFVKKNMSNRLDNIKVMVVDGRTKTGNLVKCILNRLGFRNVFIANDATAGVQIIRDKQIDIIFADWDLFVLAKPPSNDPKAKAVEPEILPLSGAKFVERLRSSPSSPNPFVPVVMLLPSSSVNEMRIARDSGVNEIVLKPFSAAEICQKLISIIDEPRIFVNSGPYKGPCRRITNIPVPVNMERRMREMRFLQPQVLKEKRRIF